MQNENSKIEKEVQKINLEFSKIYKSNLLNLCVFRK